MKENDVARHAREIAAFIRFEEVMMDYLFSNGHLSPALRPLWAERLRSRKLIPGGEALKGHLRAVRDCLEMVAEWRVDEVTAADAYFAKRGSTTISELRQQLHWIKPKMKRPRSG